MASPPETDPYQVALEVFEDRVEEMKQSGEIRRVSQITNDGELDDHFDDLVRVYGQVCREMDLDWPPLLMDFAQKID